MKCDLGVRILYLVYARVINPNEMKRIPHELIKSSPVFYHLSLQQEDIDDLLTKIAEGQVWTN